MFIVAGLLGKGRFRDIGRQVGQIVTDFLIPGMPCSYNFLNFLNFFKVCRLGYGLIVIVFFSHCIMYIVLMYFDIFNLFTY